ncbi:hypothetical protein [Streptomyces sp. NPDC127190]|uniref:hypothetical protein n=1 Tax=unclassified Streptomyces TaxID=2593676 RepID=UPI00363E94AF
MLTEKTGRSPQDLAAELAALSGLDWPWVWAGPPQGGSPAFREWCARYAWEPENAEGNLIVRTAAGGRLTFGSGGQWNPVDRLDHVAWDLAAATPADNEQVIGAAADAWARYLDAAAGVLGAPLWTGPWDAPDFPEPPHGSYWPSRDFRLRSRRPYRFAYWRPGADGPFVVLDQSVSFPTWGQAAPGGSMIWLTVHRPVDGGSDRP